MKVVPPVKVTQSELVSSDVPIDDYPEWESGTSYVVGDRVVYSIEAWEALADNTGSQPSEDNTDWLRLGYVNRWRMFRDGRDSQTSQTDQINVTIVYPRVINTLSALGLVGEEIQLTVTDATDGVVYDETAQLVDIGVADWWEYFFLPYDQVDAHVFDGIPPYDGADFDLSVRGATTSSEAACGRVVAGVARTLGTTQHGTSVGVLDYSTKERDGFGNLTLKPRRQVRLANYDVLVPSDQVSLVQQLLSRLAAEPTLFIGDDGYRATIVYGVYRDFTETISGPQLSELTIDVEGF